MHGAIVGSNSSAGKTRSGRVLKASGWRKVVPLPNFRSCRRFGGNRLPGGLPPQRARRVGGPAREFTMGHLAKDKENRKEMCDKASRPRPVAMRGLPAIGELAPMLQRRIIRTAVLGFRGGRGFPRRSDDDEGIVWPVGAYMTNRLRAGGARGTVVRAMAASAQAGTFN